MRYSSLVYNLLTNVFWSITPALPTGSLGTRPPVGFPENIPDITFIAREFTAADGFTNVARRDHLNGFIQTARSFHVTYGLAPININSLEDILIHPRILAGPIGRIRVVAHGSAGQLFLPVFTGGLWSVGIESPLLQALQSDDESGLRFLFTAGNSTTQSPLTNDVVIHIVTGIRALNSLVLAPFGVQASGLPSGDALKYFDVVNDLYQVRHGTFVVGNTLLTAAQKAVLTASLTLIENAIKSRLRGTTIGATTITDTHLHDFRDAVLAVPPVELGFLGPIQNLGAGAIAAMQTALAVTPRVENDIRSAIVGAVRKPLFFDHLSGIVAGLTIFSPSVLNLGGSTRDETFIRANANLEAFALSCVDLHFLKNGRISIAGTPATSGQLTTLRTGVLAISDIIRGRITSSGSTITATQLNNLRTAIENLPLIRSGVTGVMTIDQRTLTQLAAANTGMQNGFRTRLDHFRTLMQPADASKVDIRGCLVAASPTFLDVFRDFLGTTTNKPIVTAPNQFQSFPNSFRARFTIAEIDAIVTGGITDFSISAADVTTAFTMWTGLIDFDSHFDFITALFDTSARKLDFATLGWRVWRIGAATTGIPILRMEASRIDDMVSLNLGDAIERFRVIFDLPAAAIPNAATRGRLNQLQPHLTTFKAKGDEVAAGPVAAQLPQLFTDLTNLVTGITGVPGFEAPASTLAPASASLADIQASVGNIRTHLETKLTSQLNPFFVAVQGRVAHANARIRYYYNIGLPLLLQSSTVPTSFAVSIFMTAATAAVGITLTAGALRSWMRIQWTGTPAQATAMNTTIRTLLLTNNTQLGEGARVAMVSEDDPTDFPNSAAGISPTQAFHDHIVTRP